MKSKFILLFLICVQFFSAQNFTWMKGASQSGLPGTYGTMGVPSSSANPGCRHGSGTWVDSNGDLWLFGGEGYATVGSPASSTSWLNDLWKYTVSTNQWTWIGGTTFTNQAGTYGTMGVAAPSNQPGGREFPNCWVDNTGKFWMFGGSGFGAAPTLISPTRMNDLWRYDPATNLWTWMGGSTSTMQNGNYGVSQIPAVSNQPGSRQASATWKDAAGDLWLFGGRGYPASGVEGFLNDVWKYSISSNQWTWMGGTNQMGQTGVYGSLGVPSISNLPGGREFPVAWTDAQNTVYIFGGRGQGYFNDLWKFNPVTNTWAWIKGANFSNQIGTYGTMGTTAASNVPGGRFAEAHWTDAYGQFYVFGGQGWAAANNSVNSLNDLWKYDPCSNNWTWLKGSDTLNVFGTYGTQGVPATANVPGGRIYINCWNGKDGKLWLMGGEGFGASVFVIDHLQDLWKYDPVQPSDSAFSVTGNNLCTNTQATLSASSSTSAPVQWFSTATSTPVLFSGIPFITPTLTTSSTFTTYNYFAQTACSLRPRVPVTITISPLPIINIVGNNQFCAGSFTLSATGANSYTWTNGSNSAIPTITAAPGIFTVTVSGTSNVGCLNSTTKTITINSAPSVSASVSQSILCNGVPANISASGASSYSWSNGQTQANFTLTVNTFSNVSLSVIGTDNNGCTHTATLAIKFLNCNGLAEFEKNNTITVYPNPSDGLLFIDHNYNGIGELSIFSLQGELLSKQNLQDNTSKIQLELPQGLYFLRIHVGDAVQTKYIEIKN